ncbi:GNAT family N-acetyltransferase [Pseudonocardia lacus]|uniref:GNAT family N-acetyltransferase n=1 Tax=Pseudonocardia lacus TaxID=2835865 RepID=UPI001BDD2AEB|nr:GNAT family N-acetyltransferase [Pseudonocardia lacus]
MPLLVAPALPRTALARHVQPTLRGDGVRLRPWRPRDTAGVLVAFADPDIQHWHRRRLDPDEAAEWVGGWGRLWRAGTDACWAVADPDDRLIGYVALRGFRPFAGSAKVSYWVLPGARGAGVATRAVRLAGHWAFTVLGLHRIELVHSVRNTASCRVAERAGYALEGTMRGHMRHVDGWHDVHLHARLHDDPRLG